MDTIVRTMLVLPTKEYFPEPVEKDPIVLHFTAALPSRSRQGACDLPFFSTYTGVADHQTFRLDKWDFVPAFDWNRLGL